MIGTRLGPYLLIERIGSGGMGEVFLARDETIGREVAIKVLHDRALANSESRRRFRREALALSRLNHPNVASIHDFQSHEGIDFIVMENLVGRSLADRLKEGPLPEAEILEHAIAIASALEAAHASKIVHRDLKPGNIMLTEPHGLKVLDFGLAKLESTGSLAFSERLSSVLPAGGTLRYMAPEQVQGADVDERADLYTLGVVIYEMAIGRAPFEAEAPALLCQQILRERPRAPRSIRPRLSPRLEWIILRLLRKNPAERHASASSLIADLRRVQQPLRIQDRIRFAWDRHARRRWAPLLGAGLLSLGLVGVIANPGGRRWLTGGAAPIRSIAVLPLVNLSGDPEQEFLADGMTEELITELAQIPSLKVVSRTSIMSYKGTKKAVATIGKELGVDAVVEGSVERIGDRVRITNELVRAATDEHLWAETHERGRTDLIDLRAEAADALSGEIRSLLGNSGWSGQTRRRKVGSVAYDNFLRGRYYVGRVHNPDFSRAIEYFEEAIRLQPDYAEAYAEEAFCYMSLSLYVALPEAEGFSRAKALARRAIEIDSTLAEGHAVLGRLLMLRDWDFPEAEKHFRRALQLDPNDARVHRMYATHLAVTGRLGEAVAHSQRSLALDPVSVMANQNLATMLLWAGRLDESITQSFRTVELDSTWGDVRMELISAYQAKGMYREAADQLLIAIRLDPRLSPGYALVRDAYERGGPPAAFRAFIEWSGEKPLSEFCMAEYNCFLGNRDGAMRWLEKGYATRYQGLLYMHLYPEFAILNSDPRYRDLLRRVGLPLVHRKTAPVQAAGT